MTDTIRVLVVDDDPALQRLIVTLLERSGMAAVSAESASKAAEILDDEPLPDVMLLDLMLPEISGVQFLKQLREKERYDDMPVIILSALADPEQIREGLDSGADRYLTKPYLANNLVKTVRDILQTGRIRR